MSEDRTKTAAFEVEAASLEEFLRLLELREAQVSHDPSFAGMDAGVVRRAVFVTQLYDSKGTSMSVPWVRRYVVAGFALGEDLVSYERVTSAGIEFPNAPNHLRDGESPNARQEGAYEEIRAEIAGRIEDRGWAVPVLEGFLHQAFDPKRGGAS